MIVVSLVRNRIVKRQVTHSIVFTVLYIGRPSLQSGSQLPGNASIASTYNVPIDYTQKTSLSSNVLIVMVMRLDRTTKYGSVLQSCPTL